MAHINEAIFLGLQLCARRCSGSYIGVLLMISIARCSCQGYNPDRAFGPPTSLIPPHVLNTNISFLGHCDMLPCCFSDLEHLPNCVTSLLCFLTLTISIMAPSDKNFKVSPAISYFSSLVYASGLFHSFLIRLTAAFSTYP